MCSTGQVTRSAFDAEPTAKRIRAVLQGDLVLDSTDVLLVWEHPHYPQYYVPRDHVVAELVSNGTFDDAPGNFGVAECHDVVTAHGRRAERAAWGYPDHPEVSAFVRFAWDPMDWFEEDELVFVHPRSPYTRVDALRSSQEVLVQVDGVAVAHSVRPTVLFETGLPPRWYLPPTDVRLDLLRTSDTRTHCPYKGEARYYSVAVGEALHEDLVWYYTAPFRESAPIAGLLAFYDERVDLFVNGVKRDQAPR